MLKSQQAYVDAADPADLADLADAADVSGKLGDNFRKLQSSSSMVWHMPTSILKVCCTCSGPRSGE